MDYYYNSGQNMSSRGRFSSRGSSSYRGGGRGESSYRGSRPGGYSSSRGYSTSRGRGSYYPKYETSSSKYSSDSSTTRYTSHNRGEDASYRKQESSYASSRDHSHHRSDSDVGRKRMRNDSYSQSQGTTGSRRSHEMEDYRGSSDGGNRYATSNSYTESRSYSDNRGVFKKLRLTTDYKSKEEYRGRKDLSRSSGPMTKIRSSFRGRYIRGRALIRRGGDSFLARKRASFSAGGSSKTTSKELLAIRRKILRIRRFQDRAKLKVTSEDKKEAKVPSDSVGADAETAEEGENGDAKVDEGELYDEKVDEKKEKTKVKKEEGEICEGESDYKEKEKSSKKSSERLELKDYFRRPFIKLQCPQCSMKCVTFKQYSLHLYHPTHVKAMREKSQQLKQNLASMRIAQRAKQKKMDEEDLMNMSTKTTFCFICKLNYSQDRSVHQASEAHKKLKSFLQPYCSICRTSFKNAMSYEKHICSLDHMRKKNILDEKLNKTKSSGTEYLDNFMVLDSVGSGDEGEDNKDEKPEVEGKKEKTEIKSKDLTLVKVGAEFIQKVEALYCEVCRTYLSNSVAEATAIKLHCRTNSHIECFLRFGNDDLLKKIQKSKGADGNKEDVKVEGKGAKKEAKDVENHEEGGEDEDKLWADVTDLLNQVEPETKSDDEDEEEKAGGRFDRFKSNEKKENGEINTSEEAIGEKESDLESAEEAIKKEAEIA